VAGPHPDVAAARTAVRRALADVPAGPVLVGCSGGADSLALAAATAFVAARAGRRAGAVVVDHGWTPGSAAVAARAAAQCEGLGLDPVDVVRLSDGTDGGDGADGVERASATGGAGGPEGAARAGRYAAFRAAAARYAAAAVLVAHTLDDQAETVLLGLARGSGARSLAGMAAVRPLVPAAAAGPLLVRPFLGLRRAQTEQVCHACGLEPWLDPANADPAYARSRVRAALAGLGDALGPGLPEALARTGDLLREDADALDGAALDLLATATAATTDGPAGAGDEPPADVFRDLIALDVATLAAAPAAVRRRALLAAARRAGSPAGSLARRHVLAVDALVVAWRGQGAAHLPGHVVVRRVCGRLLLAAATRWSRGEPDPSQTE
jgi:tRNA(Ile)-lysidine synthase